MHLKILSSLSKLATTVAILPFVGKWFLMKKKIDVIPEKWKQNEPLTEVKSTEGVQIVKNV